MTIQINPVDFRGFSMGSSVPNLPNVGALGLQAAQLAMNQQNANREAEMAYANIRSRDEAMLRQNILERQRLAQQDAQFNKSNQMDQRKMGLLLNQQNFQNTQDVNKAQYDMMADQQRIGLARDTLMANTNADAQKSAFEQMKMGVEELAKKKESELKDMGSFAVMAKTALSQVKDPNEANILRKSIVEESVSNGYIPKEMGDTLNKMPISSFGRFLDTAITQNNMAQQLQALNKANNPGQAGTVRVTDAEGNTIEYQPLTKAAQTEEQKSVLKKDSLLTQFDKLKKEYDPLYHTYVNQAQFKLSKEAEKLQGIPGIEQGAEGLAQMLTGKSPEERSKFIQKRTSYMNTMSQIFNDYRKEITGAAAGLQEIDRLQKSFINGDMSPSELQGALDQIRTKYKSESDQAKKALGQGINTSIYDMSDEELLKAYNSLGNK